ncbi:hypothetical protein L207DRAFT_527201 [Hyaloscypha variabilis F]|uniref:Uncharacterized protein n=1 Tax=Hyaloscypha variabilis (strain UAMH 11265 / GT02V1 / F) TaxID=1149755 RepID=A0A2J6RUY9_HYAVF|nr:hypothetical protein L207DRAFT_527201 [Hyaloscypha variabilis F]
MHFSLITIQLIILTSSRTLASDYELPLHLASRQSGFFCVPVFLLYPDTWTTCGSGYISPLCNCCTGGLIGCLKLTQTCAIDATGVAICCDDSSPDCPPTFGGGGNSVTITYVEIADGDCFAEMSCTHLQGIVILQRIPLPLYPCHRRVSARALSQHARGEEVIEDEVEISESRRKRRVIRAC